MYASLPGKNDYANWYEFKSKIKSVRQKFKQL